MITSKQFDMKRFFKMIAVPALTLGLMLCGSAASAQKSPAFKAKYKIAEDADLRILDDNIWDYSQDTIPPRWKEIGEDPRDFKRAPQFARLVKDYMPDVFAFQEYSSHMHKEFYPLVQKSGYVIAWESKEDWNNTPIFYNEKTMEPLYVSITSTLRNNGATTAPSHSPRLCSAASPTARCSALSAHTSGGRATRQSLAARWRGLHNFVWSWRRRIS